MKWELFQGNPILNLSFRFSLMVIDYCEFLETNHKYIVSRQLLKSATSIGANVMEAQNSESREDFIHKIKIAAKEAGETQYWLMLCDYAPSYPDCKPLLEKLQELNKIISKILSTMKQGKLRKPLP